MACGILASGLLSAPASPTLRLSTDGGASWLVIQDNVPPDSDPTPGVISYSSTSLGGWALSIASGQAAPFTGTPDVPNMDLHTINVSSAPATLIVQWSDTNLTTFASETYIDTVSLGTDGTVNQSSFRDSGNVLFGTTQTYSGLPVGTSPSLTALLLTTTGPVTGNAFSSNGVVVSASGNVPNSLTIETVINHPAGGSTSVDAHLFAQPQPPCNCLLSFTGPRTLTVCSGDVIPDVTATNDCGFGPVGVPVTVTGLSTNGTCPQIITRTNQAVDGCGNPHTLVQTITVNCKPDCTITPSVTTTLVGATNTASVADAGAGASYDWNILNGTILSGQNTPTITWKAGSNTSIPVSIMITVTNSTGCFSFCSASVKLTTPPPPPFGSGDAATMGFWQNKNGQYLINNAPAGPPTLANWLATTFPCLYGATAPASDNLTGKPNSAVASLFTAKFSQTGQKKQECQVFSVALACYFTSTSLGGGTGPVKFGFNQTPGGTGAKLFNVGPYGTALGLVNNTSYPILQILQAANNVRCGNQSASLPFDLFNNINQGGDIK